MLLGMTLVAMGLCSRRFAYSGRVDLIVLGWLRRLWFRMAHTLWIVILRTGFLSNRILRAGLLRNTVLRTQTRLSLIAVDRLVRWLMEVVAACGVADLRASGRGLLLIRGAG